MSGDLHSTVTTDLGSSVTALRTLQAEYARLGVEVKKATTASEALKKSASKGIGAGVQKAGQSLQKAGGVFGSTVGQIAGGANGDGIFAKLAVVAGLGSLSIKAFGAVIDKVATDAADVGARMQRISTVLEKAQDSMDKTALAAAHDSGTRAQLLAVGGPELLQKLEQIIESGVVSRKEGERGLLSIYGKYGPGARADNTTTAALASSMVGVPFDQAAKELMPFGPILGDRGTAQRAVGNTVANFYGRGSGDPALILAEAVRNIFSDQKLAEARDVAATEGAAGAVGMGMLGDGRASRAARQALADAKSPESTAMLGIYKENQAQTKILQLVVDEFKSQRDEKSFLMYPISNLTLRFGEFMAEQKLLREQRLQGAALFNP